MAAPEGAIGLNKSFYIIQYYTILLRIIAYYFIFFAYYYILFIMGHFGLIVPCHVIPHLGGGILMVLITLVQCHVWVPKSKFKT